MRVARVRAQAKVNLLLRVGPRELSGYHQIQTVFQRIDLADEIVVRLGGREQSLDCVGPFMPTEGLGPVEKNLAFRAATLYAEHNDWVKGFAIEVTKNIPVGGGLGGGSADAAGVLRAIDALAPKPVGPTLTDLGRLLGADVNFLIDTSPTAVVPFGYGDWFQPIEPMPSRPIVLAVPRFGVSTADAYRWIDEAGGGTLATYAPDNSPAWPQIADWEDVLEQSHNDFERVVEAKHPELRRIREGLAAAGAQMARLAGSGSTVFGVFSDRAPSEAQLSLNARVIVTRTSDEVVEVEVLQ